MGQSGIGSRHRARRIGPAILVVLATATLALSILAGYAGHTVFDSEQFANRATDALDDEAVSDEVALAVTDDVVLQADRDLIGLRPVIEEAIGAVVRGGAFQALFRGAVVDLHRSIFERDARTVTLTVLDVGVLAQEALRALAPGAAAELGRRTGADVVDGEPPAALVDLAQAAEDVRELELLLLVLTALLYAGAFALSTDRRRTATHAGVAALVAGIVLVIVWQVGRVVLAARFDDPQLGAAAGGVWDAFLGDLRTALLILAASGAVVAAAAQSMIRPVEVEAPLRAAWRVVTRQPERTALRVLRAALLLALGVLVVTSPLTALTVALVAVGIYIAYAGVAELLGVIISQEQVATRARTRDARRERRRTVARRAAVAAVPIVLVLGTAGLFLGLGGVSRSAPPLDRCNGHPELCDRAVDQVVLPATHNSMSAVTSKPPWLFAAHEQDIGGQLERGVRALLIDTHYGVAAESSKVKTDLGEFGNAERREYVREFGAEAVDAALRIRDSLGAFQGDGERGIYLCHGFCEVGATPLPDALRQIRDFLVTHPTEVLVVINQDEGVTPQDFTAAVKDADLDDLAYRGPTDEWPTLREMIESGRRVVFLAENRAGAAPWYRSAFETITQETPFRFGEPRELVRRDLLARSCRPNRGPATAPFFLLNHWVDTSPSPRPSNAERVNAFQPLLRRAHRCERLRDHLPNLVAVDFFETGDLFEVVDRLNGVG